MKSKFTKSISAVLTEAYQNDKARFLSCLVFYGRLKYKWNIGIIQLTREDLQIIKEIQLFIHEGFQEYEYLFHWKNGIIPDIIKSDTGNRVTIMELSVN